MSSFGNFPHRRHRLAENISGVHLANIPCTMCVANNVNVCGTYTDHTPHVRRLAVCRVFFLFAEQTRQKMYAECMWQKAEKYEVCSLQKSTRYYAGEYVYAKNTPPKIRLNGICVRVLCIHVCTYAVCVCWENHPTDTFYYHVYLYSIYTIFIFAKELRSLHAQN